VFDLHTLLPGTLAWVFGGTLLALINFSFCVGASKNATAYVAVDIVVFVVFYTNWVAFSACIADQDRGGGGQVIRWGSGGGNRNENESVPRRNSLGDLKIPARISEAQVALRWDLGMVREFTMNNERWFFFLCFFRAVFIDMNLFYIQN